jgi:hypothetical protein
MTASFDSYMPANDSYMPARSLFFATRRLARVDCAEGSAYRAAGVLERRRAATNVAKVAAAMASHIQMRNM